MTSLKKAKLAAKVLSAKKAEDIIILDVDKITTLADYFVIASANNSTQVKALAEEVEYKLKLEGAMPDHIEGRHSDTWILIDYRDIVVNVFLNETREFYDIERLWSDATRIDTTDID